MEIAEDELARSAENLKPAPAVEVVDEESYHSLDD
jgi:hypothetical protein